MKKVLFVIESLGGGGAEKVLTTIVKYLDKTKFDITVLLVTETGVYVDEVKKYCKVKSMLPKYEDLNSVSERIRYKLHYKYIYSASPEKVYSKYVKEKYDIEIAFVEGFATKLVSASKNSESKKLAWVHIDMVKNPYADKYFKNIAEEKTVYNRYDRVVCVSNSVKEVLDAKFDLKNKSIVIYNPVDTKEIIKKSAEKITKKKALGIQLVTVGRLEMQKGYDRLIKALGKLKQQNTELNLWILGEGSMRDELELLIKENHLEDNVSLLGFQENPYKWISQADAFVCTSRAEGFSLVIAEAIVLEKPILSVNCSGPNELLDYGKYGILVENTDSEILNMLDQLICDKINLDNLTKLSKLRVEYFNIKNIMQQVEELMK